MHDPASTRRPRLRALLPFMLLLSGPTLAEGPLDPLEPVNRAVFSFNEVVDEVAFEPLARGYRAVVPQPARTGVVNFFSNLDDVTVLANDLLQLKLHQATEDFLRIVFNTTFGLLGVWDVAGEMGLRKHNEDLGQTLGRWGIGSGPYLVLPFFGPSSFRDGVGLYLDSHVTDPVYQIEPIRDRNRTLALRAVSRRADVIEALRVIEEAALDKYEFTRDFYLDRREAQVRNGRAPVEE